MNKKPGGNKVKKLKEKTLKLTQKLSVARCVDISNSKNSTKISQTSEIKNIIKVKKNTTRKLVKNDKNLMYANDLKTKSSRELSEKSSKKSSKKLRVNPSNLEPQKNSKKSKKIKTKNLNAIKFNLLHKRFVAYFEGSDMRTIWKKVRELYEKENGKALPKRFAKEPGSWESLNEWYEKKVAVRTLQTDWVEKKYYNKQDLKEQGWDEKIIKILYPKPDRVMYLGRGRYAYYYDADLVHEMQDSEEFIEHIAIKEERKRKHEERAKRKENPMIVGFGSEFIR